MKMPQRPVWAFLLSAIVLSWLSHAYANEPDAESTLLRQWPRQPISGWTLRIPHDGFNLISVSSGTDAVKRTDRPLNQCLSGEC